MSINALDDALETRGASLTSTAPRDGGVRAIPLSEVWSEAPDLAGRWRIRRVILGQGRLAGVGEAFALGDGAFAWREEGDLRLAGGTRLRAQRRYVFRIDPAARLIETFYDDGPRVGERLHSFTFAGNHRLARHRHDCPPDVYLAKLRLGGPDRFQISYRVRGPRKDYAMSTLVRRADAADR